MNNAAIRSRGCVRHGQSRFFPATVGIGANEDMDALPVVVEPWRDTVYRRSVAMTVALPKLVLLLARSMMARHPAW